MDFTKQNQNITKKCIENDIIITELSDDSFSETGSAGETPEFDVGECCFCGGECNPMSQSCGYCARGISGAVIGLTVPYELQKFVLKGDKGEKTESEH